MNYTMDIDSLISLVENMYQSVKNSGDLSLKSPETKEEYEALMEQSEIAEKIRRMFVEYLGISIGSVEFYRWAYGMYRFKEIKMLKVYTKEYIQRWVN